MADHLGSTRLAMQGSSVLARYDYLPFGERIGRGINSRSSLYGSTGSMVITGQDQVVEQQFTAKERDAESGLDYFGSASSRTPRGGSCRPTSPSPTSSSKIPRAGTCTPTHGTTRSATLTTTANMSKLHGM